MPFVTDPFNAFNEEYVTMDFFRFDAEGKIIEHWDTIQEVPNETKNGNPMY